MKKRKTNKIIILSIIGIVFIVSLLIFILNYSKDNSSFSILEKKWINDNSRNVIDVSVYNDIPVYGTNGEGVIFDFLDRFTEDYEVNFNKISYYTDTTTSLKDVSFKVIDTNVNLENNDILMYTDNYVLVSVNEENINQIEDIKNVKIGVLSNDLSNVAYYLNNASDVSYIPYPKIDDLILAMINKDLNYAVIPHNTYLNSILNNNLNILYHFVDLSKKYILTINNNNTLLSIMKKYELKFREEYQNDSYKENFLKMFFKENEITDVEQSNYNASSYVYGYTINMPYENIENNEFVGIISNYLSGCEDLFEIDFKLKKYDNIAELKQALSSGDIDVSLSYFDMDGVNIDTIYTNSIFEEDYVILSQNLMVIDSIRTLKNMEVYTVSNTYLYDYIVNNGVKAKGYDNTDELLRNISNDSIVIIDKATYNYYRNYKLSSYDILYEGKLNNQYKFVIRDVNKNTTFSKIFKYYVSGVNYNEFKYKYNTERNIVDTNIFGTTLKYVFIALLVVLVLIIGIITISKKNKKKKVIKKEEKLKFIDVMTSLKNRNYLNYNMQKWDENVIYPQSFVVIDLNNIKYINDNHGHEEGDMVIKKAASILIINQLEKTDIMRTDGNEFLIYMVGYDEKQVMDYTRKIYKELKELPYGFGASIGYSMIKDDVKTVDDAINEATLEMRNAKEKQ